MVARCPVHRAYRAVRPPRVECQTCWALYRARHPERREPKRCACGAEIQRRSKQCRTCELASRGWQPKVPPRAGEDVERDVKLQQALDSAHRYKGAYERALKAAAHEERLIRLFQTSIGAFPALPPALGLAQPPARTSSAETEAPVLLLGDLQIGEAISREETRGINAYNFEVFQQRLEYLEDRVVDILTYHQRGPFERLKVIGLGDYISGRIHVELQKYGAQHYVDQIYLGGLSVALFLARLSRHWPIDYEAVSGNHGRPDKEKEAKQYFKNLDYLFNAIVATALRDSPRVTVTIPRSIFTVTTVAGHRILVSHGMELPPSSLGIPLYSINRASASYQELLSIAEEGRFDYWVLGHYHRPLELDSSIVNGTMAGLSELGIGKFKPIRPMQKLLGFHPRYGKAWEYPIRLDFAPAPARVYTFGHDMSTGDALGLLSDRLSEATA